MQVSATIMYFNKGNVVLYSVYCESVTINQNTTDAFDRPKIICRHCAEHSVGKHSMGISLKELGGQRLGQS